MEESFKEKDKKIVDAYLEKKPWGMNISIDLKECDLNLIKDEEHIKKFLKELVILVDMKPFGDPILKNFGEEPRVSGISATQLIETSNITAHFANLIKSAFIDIFSCKSFKPYEAAFFAKEYFKAQDVIVSPVNFRF